MKKLLVVFVVFFLSACGEKTRLDGTYSNNQSGMKISMIFKPDGTVQAGVGGTIYPIERPYEINGSRVKIAGEKGDEILTILENGDLLAEQGLRFTKELPSSPTAAAVANIPSTSSVTTIPAEVNSTEQSDICDGLNMENTNEQNECLSRKFTQSDRQLNETYKQLMATLDDTRKTALKKEQIAWIKVKEAKCIQAGKEFEGGSMETTAIEDCKVQETEQRLAYLRSYK